MALGAQYKFTKDIILDMGYAHVFLKKATINDVAPTASSVANQTFQQLKGSSRSKADLIGIQLTWNISSS